MASGAKMSWRAPEVLVPLVGLLYTAIFLTYVFLPFVIQGSIPDYATILIPFTLIFLAGAFGVWKQNRYGYVVALVMSALFIVAEGSFVSDAIGNPSNLETFLPVVTIIPALVASLVYSALGLRIVWRKNAVRAPGRSIPYSSTLAILIVGFVIGALVVGAFAGATQARLLANSGKSADIVIVLGASNQGNSAGYYSPADFTAKVGDTVVWSNADGSSHTITSASSSALSFDSGVVSSGGTFSYTFTQAGTYSYYCTLHPWMKGTIVVTSN